MHFVAKRAKRLFGAYISLIICQSIVPDWGQRERSAAWKRLRASEVRRNLSRIVLLAVVGGGPSLPIGVLLSYLAMLLSS